METQIKQCQSCKNDFTIESEDFTFYEKIKVPPPTFCPECRLIRRFASYKERALYKDTCDMCEKEIVSMYAPDTPFKVYCSSCWWSDDWDAEDYGQDYDFTRPFFEQFCTLQKKVPCQATNTRNCTNCNYCHGLIRCKNCFFVFAGLEAKNCLYCQIPIFTQDSMDSDGVMHADHV